MTPKPQTIGVALMLVAALLFSTAGIFTKFVVATAWQVIFWRGVFSAILTTGEIARQKTIRREFAQMGKRGVLAAIIGALGTAAFLSAFKYTTVANVALIYATVPLFSAAFAWLFIGEKPGLFAIMGSALGIVGIAVLLNDPIDTTHLFGDALALVMTLALALLFVLYRAWPNTPSAGPTALSSVLLLPIAAMMQTPFTTAINEIAILAAFGLVFALASVLMFEAAKRLPSGRAALLSTSETPFALILAWMILSEIPTTTTLIGGALVLAGALLGNLNSRA